MGKMELLNRRQTRATIIPGKLNPVGKKKSRKGKEEEMEDDEFYAGPDEEFEKKFHDEIKQARVKEAIELEGDYPAGKERWHLWLTIVLECFNKRGAVS